MLKKSATRPVKKMVIMKHINPIKSNSPIISKDCKRNNLLTKPPNLYYVNSGSKGKKNSPISNTLHFIKDKSLSTSRNSKENKPKSTVKNKQMNHEVKNHIRLLNIFDYCDMTIKKFKINKNTIINFNGNKQFQYDKIFKHNKEIKEYMNNCDIKTNCLINILSDNRNEIKNLLIGNSFNGVIGNLLSQDESTSFKARVITIKEDGNKTEAVDFFQRDREKLPITKGIVDLNIFKEVEYQKKEDLLKCLSSFISSIDLTQSNNGYLISLYSKIKITIFFSIRKSLTFSPFECMKPLIYSHKIDLIILSLNSINTIMFPYNHNIIRRNTNFLTQNYHKESHSQSPSSSFPSSTLILTNLNEENKLLQLENQKLREQISNLHMQINTLQSLLKSKPNELILNENRSLLKLNREINENYKTQIKTFTQLNTALKDYDLNVYSFDDDELSELSKENKKRFSAFKQRVLQYYTDISNKEEYTSFDYSNEYIDSFKSLIESFNETNEFIFDINDNNLNKNFMKLSFVNSYYENIIIQLINYSIYQSKRANIVNFINDHIMSLCSNISLYKSNDDKVSDIISDIKVKITESDTAVEEFINESNKIRKMQCEKLGKVFEGSIKLEEITNSLSQSTINNFTVTECVSSTKGPKLRNEKFPLLKQTTTNSFFGYFKNEMNSDYDDSKFGDL